MDKDTAKDSPTTTKRPLPQAAKVLIFMKKVAGPTRLELATSGVTGRRSNQLNYDPAVVFLKQEFYRNRTFLTRGTFLSPASLLKNKMVG